METRRTLVIITGLSGSGKSTVAKCFEDLGYYCVDNLPLPLLRELLQRPFELVEGERDVAVVTDVRAPGFSEELPRLLEELGERGTDPVLLFLEASNETLVRRFEETRRPHPLAGEGLLIDAIREERELLAELRGMADRIVDSSECSIHEIRSQVYQDFGREDRRPDRMVVSVISFGYKHGIPYGTDLLFDVRFLPNPHFVPGLRELTGAEAEVQEYLDRQPEFGELVERLEAFLRYLLPHYQGENRSYLSVAVGCTGGRHRSVAVAERLKSRLDDGGWPVHLIHRDASR